MANPISHAKKTLERVHNKVQPYMANLFSRLATNYLLLFVAVIVLNFGMQLVAQFVSIPRSTGNTLAFSIVLVILVFGWRFLENRNHATALFVIYVRYSSQKRSLENTLAFAEEGALEDQNTLYVQIDLLEEYAGNLLEAASDAELQAREA